MKNFQFYAAIAAMIFCCGCGYTCGSIAHPQLKTVAVAPVINDTTSYNSSAILRGLLSERFTTDGSMQLKTMETADCIVYAKITDVRYQAIDYGVASNGDDTYLANEWRCEADVEFSVVLPGRGKPLIANRKVTGKTKFINGPDMETSRNNALRQALFSATKTIVSSITEGW